VISAVRWVLTGKGKPSGTRSRCFALPDRRRKIVSHQADVRDSGVLCAWHTKAGPTVITKENGARQPALVSGYSKGRAKSGPVCFLVGPVRLSPTARKQTRNPFRSIGHVQEKKKSATQIPNLAASNRARAEKPPNSAACLPPRGALASAAAAVSTQIHYHGAALAPAADSTSKLEAAVVFPRRPASRTRRRRRHHARHRPGARRACCYPTRELMQEHRRCAAHRGEDPRRGACNTSGVTSRLIPRLKPKRNYHNKFSSFTISPHMK
jgi:hypothetical protein